VVTLLCARASYFCDRKTKRFNEKLFDWKEIKITNNIFLKKLWNKLFKKIVEQLLDKSFEQKSKNRNRKIFRIFLKKNIFKNHNEHFLTKKSRKSEQKSLKKLFQTT
jgi:hypothetical protein